MAAGPQKPPPLPLGAAGAPAVLAVAPPLADALGDAPAAGALVPEPAAVLPAEGDVPLAPALPLAVGLAPGVPGAAALLPLVPTFALAADVVVPLPALAIGVGADRPAPIVDVLALPATLVGCDTDELPPQPRLRLNGSRTDNHCIRMVWLRELRAHHEARAYPRYRAPEPQSLPDCDQAQVSNIGEQLVASLHQSTALMRALALPLGRERALR